MKDKSIILKHKMVRLQVCLGMLFFLIANIVLAENSENSTELKKQIPKRVFESSDWNIKMNEQEEKKDIYPEKRKITPETVRLTLNEYYVPHVSELLVKGVDCIEWLNKLDDPYLNRYKLDLRVDPGDDRLKLFWNRQF